jgi:hypothetical protein
MKAMYGTSIPQALALKAFQDAVNQGSEASRYAALVGSEILFINKKLPIKKNPWQLILWSKPVTRKSSRITEVRGQYCYLKQ